MNQTVETAKAIGSSDVSVQVWVLILLGIAAVVWAVNAFRSESAELRKDLRAQSRDREDSLKQLIICVESNTAVLRDTKEVLGEVKYQLKRGQETLDKFAE